MSYVACVVSFNLSYLPEVPGLAAERWECFSAGGGALVSKVSWMSNEALPLKDPLFIVHMETDEGKHEEIIWIDGLLIQRRGSDLMKPTICTSSWGRHPLMAALQTNLYVCIIDFIRKSLFVCSNDDDVWKCFWGTGMEDAIWWLYMVTCLAGEPLKRLRFTPPPFHNSTLSLNAEACKTRLTSSHTHRHLTNFAWTPVLMYCLKKWLAFKEIQWKMYLSNPAQVCLQTRHRGQRPKIPQIPK